MSEKHRIWIDWGSGQRDEVQCYTLDSLPELNAFLEGILAATTALGIEDFRQFDTEAELDEAFREAEVENCNSQVWRCQNCTWEGEEEECVPTNGLSENLRICPSCNSLEVFPITNAEE